MKKYPFPVGKSGLNPFIANPIIAKNSKGTIFKICHAVATLAGVDVIGTLGDDNLTTSFTLNVDEITILNSHEAERLLMLFKSLGITEARTQVPPQMGD